MWGINFICRSEEGVGAEYEALGSYDFFPVTYILPGEYAIFVEVCTYAKWT